MGKRKGRKTEKWKEEGKRGEGKGNRTGILERMKRNWLRKGEGKDRKKG